MSEPGVVLCKSLRSPNRPKGFTVPHKRILRHVRTSMVALALLFSVVAATVTTSTPAQAMPAAPVVAATPTAMVASLGASYTTTDVLSYFKRRASAGGWPSCSSSSKRRDAACYALKQRGDDYRWAAEGPDAFDCSGLVKAAYRYAGKYLPHSSGMIASSTYSYRVSRSGAWMGDVAHKPGHIGLVLGWYGGALWMMHASSYHDAVVLAKVPSTMTIRRIRL